MVYGWKYQMPVKAQDAGEHIEKLERQFGKVTPKIVLESARSEDALLHPCFEWNDTTAAELYRETQAGNILRALVVTVECQDQPTKVRAFVNIKTESDSSFLSITKVLQDDDLRDRMLSDAQRELKSFRDKYANLAELSGVFSSIDGYLCERRAM